jgi:hypothetical protein
MDACLSGGDDGDSCNSEEFGSGVAVEYLRERSLQQLSVAFQVQFAGGEEDVSREEDGGRKDGDDGGGGYASGYGREVDAHV